MPGFSGGSEYSVTPDSNSLGQVLFCFSPSVLAGFCQDFAVSVFYSAPGSWISIYFSIFPRGRDKFAVHKQSGFLI